MTPTEYGQKLIAAMDAEKQAEQIAEVKAGCSRNAAHIEHVLSFAESTHRHAVLVNLAHDRYERGEDIEADIADLARREPKPE